MHKPSSKLANIYSRIGRVLAARAAAVAEMTNGIPGQRVLPTLRPDPADPRATVLLERIDKAETLAGQLLGQAVVTRATDWDGLAVKASLVRYLQTAPGVSPDLRASIEAMLTESIVADAITGPEPGSVNS